MQERVQDAGHPQPLACAPRPLVVRCALACFVLTELDLIALHSAAGRIVAPPPPSMMSLLDALPSLSSPAVAAAAKQAQHLDNVKREIKILTRLRGTLSVVHFKGAYEDDQSIHLVMELCRRVLGTVSVGQVWRRRC